DQPPAQRHVEALGQGRETGVGLDLQLVTGDEHAIEPQTGDADEHRGARPVVQREADASLLGAKAVEIGQPLGQVAWDLWTWPARRRHRADGERKLGAVDDLT